MKDIYRITNTINGKCYIGQTKQGALKRLNQHSKTDSLIGRAIRKYGISNFVIEILYTIPNDKADEYENMCILENNCIAPNGYNTNEYGRLCGEYKTKYKILCYNTYGYNAIMNCSPVFAWYILKIVNFVNKEYLIMKNHKTPIKRWFELYKLLEMTNTNTQTKFKKFCETHDLIRIDKTLRTKDNNKFTTRFILNPFLVRKCSHIGQIAIGRYQDYAKEGITINTYAYRFLQCFGVIDDFE